MIEMSKKIEVTCAQCGTRLMRAPSAVRARNFCNTRCYHAWKKPNTPAGKDSPHYASVEVPCAQCGKLTRKPPSVLKQRKHVFCSRACTGAWKSANWAGEKAHQWKAREAVPCAFCGASLQKTGNHLKKRTYNFCDMACYRQWQKEFSPRGDEHPSWNGGPVTVECGWCGMEIQRVRSEIGKRQNFFCCRKHQGLWYSVHIRAEEHPNWRGGYSNNYGPNWEEQRAHARQRDRYHCRMCGLSQDALPRELDVHHIVAFREFRYVPGKNDHYLRANRLSNLVSLCPECHGQANFMAPADLHLRLIAL